MTTKKDGEPVTSVNHVIVTSRFLQIARISSAIIDDNTLPLIVTSYNNYVIQEVLSARLSVTHLN